MHHASAAVCIAPPFVSCNDLQPAALALWERNAAEFSHVESMVFLGMAFFHGDGCAMVQHAAHPFTPSIFISAWSSLRRRCGGLERLTCDPPPPHHSHSHQDVDKGVGYLRTAGKVDSMSGAQAAYFLGMAFLTGDKVTDDAHAQLLCIRQATACARS